ncbi:hypothetical protein M0805_006919 [Coniferiporia weirii]|nr:hypothetical protein M0805_006919 [Coniferiporia weirii]
MAAPPSHGPFTHAPGSLAPPPLPLGWTEHTAPGGQLYYFNAATNESTYVRPFPTFPVPPFAAGVIPPQAGPPAEKKGKKEKPKLKTPIPGTSWLRVKTTAGNVFYTHTERKESVWTVPEEIRDAVARLDLEEKEKGDLEEKKMEEEDERKRAVEMEIERIKKEVGAVGKRKAIGEPEPLGEVVVTKKARVEEEEEEGEGEEDSESEDEMEDWQREAAAQLAAEAEEEEHRRKEEEEQKKREEEEELKRKEKERGVSAINMPNRVDLSIEEAKALFKTLLREKDINHLLPWDTALPKFISDPRYVLLPSVSARRDAFDEYCRDRGRELRQAKLSAQNAPTAEENKDPKADFDKLLREEVKSTRTSWGEWRRTWKKDRRFWGWGRDDREREKRFREWLKDLGEQKRKAAQKAEADFFALLKEKTKVNNASTWKDVKRGLDSDPRYDAVGSSSLREELFNTYVKTLAEGARLPSEVNVPGTSDDDEALRKRKNKERKELAVKERDRQVKRERERVEAETARSRNALSREESELDFLTLLTDAIREPLATWDGSLSQLKTDPRFTHSILPHSQQQSLFHRHVSALRAKHTSALHALFVAHAPALDTPFAALPVSSIQTSLPATKLHLDMVHGENARGLEYEFRTWRDERNARAQKEFQEMLDENAFVEFWGRMRKMKEGGEGGMKVDVGAEDLAGEGEGDEESGKIDLKALARSIDVREIERVLKNDKRYVVFDHNPEQREKWVRAHVEKLVAPKLSVHTAEQGH